jgi:hypothetical protein
LRITAVSPSVGSMAAHTSGSLVASVGIASQGSLFARIRPISATREVVGAMACSCAMMIFGTCRGPSSFLPQIQR